MGSVPLSDICMLDRHSITPQITWMQEIFVGVLPSSVGSNRAWACSRYTTYISAERDHFVRTVRLGRQSSWESIRGRCGVLSLGLRLSQFHLLVSSVEYKSCHTVGYGEKMIMERERLKLHRSVSVVCCFPCPIRIFTRPTDCPFFILG